MPAASFTFHHVPSNIISLYNIKWHVHSLCPQGLLALETFQGARTPVTSPQQRGALVGLSLAHTRAHLWRAFLEAVCYGKQRGN